LELIQPAGVRYEKEDGLAMSFVEWLKPPPPEDTASFLALEVNSKPEATASAVAFFPLL